MSSFDLGKDRILKIFMKYAVPSVFIILSQNVAFLVDAMFIGNVIGPKGLSAITLFYPLVSFFIGLALMVAVRSNNLAGLSMGAGSHNEGNRYFNIAFKGLGIFSVFITLLAFICMSSLTRLLNVTGDIQAYVIEYGLYISVFFIFFKLNLVLSFFIKLDGKPHLLLISTGIGTVVNIVLDFLLIAVLKWSLKGAALATGISQVLIFIILFQYFYKHTNWSFEKIQFHVKDIWQICVNGSSLLISRAGQSVSSFVLNMLILKQYGVVGIAGYSIAKQVADIVTSLSVGISEASRVGISYNYGAKDFKRVKGFRNLTILSSVLIGVMIFLVTYLFGDKIASFFVKDTTTILKAYEVLKYYSIGFIVLGVNVSVGIYYAGINSPIVSNSYTVYRCFVGLILGIFVVSIMNAELWWALIFKEFSTVLLGILLYSYLPNGIVKRNHLDYKVI